MAIQSRALLPWHSHEPSHAQVTQCGHRKSHYALFAALYNCMLWLIVHRLDTPLALDLKLQRCIHYTTAHLPPL